MSESIYVTGRNIRVALSHARDAEDIFGTAYRLEDRGPWHLWQVSVTRQQDGACSVELHLTTGLLEGRPSTDDADAMAKDLIQRLRGQGMSAVMTTSGDTE